MNKDTKKLKPFQKKIYITSPLSPDIEAFCLEYSDIKASGIFSNFGKKHNLLESKLKKYLKVKNIALFNNGTAALIAAIKCLDLSGEIITTPFTFPAVINAIEHCGLKPVFCDIDENYNIDSSKIESCISTKTSAILAVHTFGVPCDFNKIEKIAKKYNLKTIYDAAHAFGVSYRNIPIGVLGDVTMFSFHATKIFNTIEGGCLCTNNNEVYEKIKLFRNFGIKKEMVEIPGINGKLNEIQSAVGLLNLPLVKNEIKRRKILYNIYVEELKNVDEVKILKFEGEYTPNYQYLIIQVSKKISRDRLYNKLKKYNIYTRKYFNISANEYKYILKNIDCPISERCSKETLALPLYGKLRQSEVKKICGILKEVVKSGK